MRLTMGAQVDRKNGTSQHRYRPRELDGYNENDGNPVLLGVYDTEPGHPLPGDCQCQALEIASRAGLGQANGSNSVCS
jgi:hypothetical protein